MVVEETDSDEPLLDRYVCQANTRIDSDDIRIAVVWSNGQITDLGVHHFDETRRERVERGLVQRLKDLGYKVTLEPAQPETSAA